MEHPAYTGEQTAEKLIVNNFARENISANKIRRILKSLINNNFSYCTRKCVFRMSGRSIDGVGTENLVH